MCPLGGLGYYEVEVLCPGRAAQFGFCILSWPTGPGYNKGVGNDSDGLSWGVDGDSALKRHKGHQRLFGRQWQEGDVVGLACDLRTGRMLVSLNGNFAPPYGKAFDLPMTKLKAWGGLCPALTAASGLFRCNLVGAAAGRPFRHAPPSQEYLAMAMAGEWGRNSCLGCMPAAGMDNVIGQA